MCVGNCMRSPGAVYLFVFQLILGDDGNKTLIGFSAGPPKYLRLLSVVRRLSRKLVIGYIL